MWKLVYTKQALKDAKKISSTGLTKKVQEILKTLETNPFDTSPPFEKLLGDLKGAYSRRINIHNRLVYQILEETKTIKIIRLWTHYE
ncbi:MAG: Txe/YoeB family addiction module toxin [Ignavibacteriota bacterium]